MPTELSSTQRHMINAERQVREALSYHSSGERLSELMRVWRMTAPTERDALFAVLAARHTLISNLDGENP